MPLLKENLKRSHPACLSRHEERLQHGTGTHAPAAPHTDNEQRHSHTVNTSELQLPIEAPVMALPNALLLPFALIPLSIFEERYRHLVQHALEHHRMFCIALMKPESLADDLENPFGPKGPKSPHTPYSPNSPSPYSFEPPFSHGSFDPSAAPHADPGQHHKGNNNSKIYHVGGIGLIRACVTLPNGNSNLILQGIARVELLGWKQREPFQIAHIRPLPNEEAETHEAEMLSARVLELCGELKDQGTHVPVPIEKQLAAIRDPSALADIVSHTFIADPFARQKLLEELSVPTRLRRLITQLQTELLG